jgi:transcriptional regulator with XRE-family HTH domain
MPHAKPDPALSATVRKLREERGVTREALAMHAGITFGSLARIELAQASPSWDPFRRIAATLGLSIGRLADAIEAHGAGSSAPIESPQHQRWREARTLAEQENERAWTALLDAVEAAEDLLNRPLSASPPSAAWLSIGERVRGASRLLASVTYCLREWQEPQDARADVVPVGEAELRSTGGWDRLAPAVRHGTLEAEND